MRAFPIPLLLIAWLLATPAPAQIERLDWLAGCWERTLEHGFTQELWTRPAGGTMLGLSRTVVGETTRAWESLRIEEEEGGLVYVALPSSHRETRFELAELGDSTAVFLNPEHDFPQHIRYRLQEDGSLLARIEGKVDGELRALDFLLRRVPCDGPLFDDHPSTPHPHYALTPDEALELAVDLANERCHRRYGASPFDADSYPINFLEDRWQWGRLDVAAKGGISAEVSFDAYGHARRIEVYLSTDQILGEP